MGIGTGINLNRKEKVILIAYGSTVIIVCVILVWWVNNTLHAYGMLPTSSGQPVHNHSTLNMPVYKKSLTFCFLRFDTDNKTNIKKPYIECNYVSGFSQKKLDTMRDYLENYSRLKL